MYAGRRHPERDVSVGSQREREREGGSERKRDSILLSCKLKCHTISNAPNQFKQSIDCNIILKISKIRYLSK